MPPPPLPPLRPDAPRQGLRAVLLAVAALAALLWIGRGQWPEHAARWFGEGRARVAIDYARLSPALQPGALAQLLGLAPLPCREDAGARICEAALAEADGLPAARLRATWRQARLDTVEIDLAWWAHHAALRQLTARLGAPARADRGAPGQEPGMAWTAGAGVVQVPRAPGWIPWEWSTLRWSADLRGAAR